MTTIQEIIRRALRESNIIAVDETPTAAEQQEGLYQLQSTYTGLFGFELGELMESVVFDINTPMNIYGTVQNQQNQISSTYIQPNTRLLCNLSQSRSLYLNPNPGRGERFSIIDVLGNFSTNNLTLIGNGRNIAGQQNIVLNTSGMTVDYMYRHDLGNWIAYTPLVLTDNSPLPGKYDELLVLLLAQRLNPKNGLLSSQETTLALQKILRKFRAEYQQSKEIVSELGLSYLPSNKYKTYTNKQPNTTILFNVGLS